MCFYCNKLNMKRISMVDVVKRMLFIDLDKTPINLKKRDATV